jgi:hypothetical protein
VPRRSGAGTAIAAGTVLGLAFAGLFVGARLGVFDAFFDRAADVVAPPPPPTTPRQRASAAATAQVRIQSVPAGADVLEVLPDGTLRLLGLTPLTLQWNVAVGDPERRFQLKKQGYAPMAARLPPPTPNPHGEPVLVDLGGTLRPSPTP